VKELDVFLEFGGFFGNIFLAGDGGRVLEVKPSRVMTFTVGQRTFFPSGDINCPGPLALPRIHGESETLSYRERADDASL